MISEEKLISLAKKKCDYAQLVLEDTYGESLNIEANKLKNIDSSTTKNYILKVWLDKKLGIATSNNLSEELLAQAIKIARVNKPLEFFYGLPQKPKYKKINTFDRKVANINEHNFKKYYEVIMQRLDKEKNNINITASQVSKTLSKTRVLNTNNIDIENLSTAFSFLIEANAIKENKLSNDYDSKSEVKLFKIDNTLNKVIEDTKTFLEAQELKQLELNKIQSYQIVPRIISDLLKNAFLDNLNGLSALKQKSIFQNKLNKKILDEKLTIIDNQTLNFGVNSSICDFEGIPSQKTTLVENGVLKNFIYDYNTAKKVNKSSTANAGLDGIEFSNIILKGKNQTDFDNKLIIEIISGAHTSNDTTTDFSVKVQKAWLQKGKQKIPLKPFMISGKVLDILQNIQGFGGVEEQREGIYTKSLFTKRINII